MNLFDFTYCGNYNRQIQNLARISPEKWSFGQSGDNGILKAIWKIHSADCMRKEKYGKRKNMPFFIQDSLISIISRFMLILFQM